MAWEADLDLARRFVLVLARVGGTLLLLPVLGGVQVPSRVRAALAAVAAMGITAGGVTAAAAVPESAWQLAPAVVGEAVVGLGMGLAVSLAFVAVQWAGQIAAQQMGLTLGQVIDPREGSSDEAVGQAYFLLAVVVFLSVGGHRAVMRGLAESFTFLPLLSPVSMTGITSMVLGSVEAATTLAVRLAGPVLAVTLVADVAVGLVGRALPQLNVLSSAIAVRAAVGLVAVVLAIGLTAEQIEAAMVNAVSRFSGGWRLLLTN